MEEIPVLRQLLVCEKVIFERDTNNVTLINCHTIRHVDRFPTPLSFVVYGLLTNGYGSFTIQLGISRLDTGQTIFARPIPIVFHDRLRTMDLAVRINDVVLPVEGSYEIVLTVNSESLGMTRIELKAR